MKNRSNAQLENHGTEIIENKEIATQIDESKDKIKLSSILLKHKNAFSLKMISTTKDKNSAFRINSSRLSYVSKHNNEKNIEEKRKGLAQKSKDVITDLQIPIIIFF